MNSIKSIRGNGKLLITGEYLVLKGATAVAIPCRYGQDISFKSDIDATDCLQWVSLDMYGLPWFEGNFDKKKNMWTRCSDQKIGQLLIEIFEYCKDYSLMKWEQLSEIESQVDFPLEWGLGTSSTLIYCLSRYFEIDGFALNKKIFKGSGYDIASAGSDRPIKYTLSHTGSNWEKVNWNPNFKEHIAFVYLGEKQSSKEELDRFNRLEPVSDQSIREISQISDKILNPSLTIDQFIELIREHENIISGNIKKSKIQEIKFSDFEGVIKSLGGWGGDFAMAVFKNEPDYSYFYQRGFPNVIPFSRMIYDSFVRIL